MRINGFCQKEILLGAGNVFLEVTGDQGGERKRERGGRMGEGERVRVR